MRAKVFDQAGSGLLVLIMLTVAVVAGQAKPRYQDSAAVQLDAGIRVSLDQAQLAKLESLSTEIYELLELPIRLNLSIDESAGLQWEFVDSAPDSDDTEERH